MTKSIRLVQLLSALILGFLGKDVQAQQCSREALTAKYWQYRDNLNKHFVLIDRRPEGCVGDGIHFVEGVHPFGETSTKHCGQRFLSGYSLPATSINQTPSGAIRGMGDRNDPNSDFFDGACADAGPSSGTNWDDDEIHNYLEMGEETPHQMQWYWTTLATEYALLIRNGQVVEAQRTLEEIYLGLQAYRRMDMLANCMAQERYEEITADFEVEDCYRNINGGPLGGQHDRGDCLCGSKYVDAPAAFNQNFETWTQNNCPFQADMSGYSGFSLREDGTQALEALNDLSENKWNIDLVGGDYAMSSMPPCTTAVSQACYNVKGKNFLSQDQMYALMQGLVMIKKYIPASATITTCDGVVENVLSIAQNIGKGLVDWPNHNPKRINWPGAKECCDEEVHISAAAGGYMSFTYAGLEMMYNFVSDNDDRYIDIDDRYFFNTLATSSLTIDNSEGTFWLEAVSFGQDIGKLPTWNNPFDPIPTVTRARTVNNLNDYDLQIYSLINNLLFPGGYNVPVDRAWFEALLCKAPCAGPCQKPSNYDQTIENGLNTPPPDGPIIWPEFECPNTPDWTGMRWEGKHGNLDWEDIYEARQFNGLDFMALYNIYMLTFPEEQTLFYNPNRPEPTNNGRFLGEDKIEGPTTLCPGQSGSYLLKTTYPNSPTLQSILWESSSNINLSSKTSNPTGATVIAAQSASNIGVSFQEVISRQQHENGIPQFSGPALVLVEDKCDFSYRKPILSELSNYDIDLFIDECNWNYQANVLGSPLCDGITFYWTATDNVTGLTINYSGLNFDFFTVMPIGLGNIGTVTITLEIHSSCGNITKTVTAPYQTCNDPWEHRQIIINPNPTNNQISIYIFKNQSQDFITSDPDGVRIRIYPTSGGTNALLDSHLYANGQYFNVSDLPNGVYQVRATAADLSPIQTNLSIIH